MRATARGARTSASPRPMLKYPRKRARELPGTYRVSGGPCDGASPRVGFGSVMRGMDGVVRVVINALLSCDDQAAAGRRPAGSRGGGSWSAQAGGYGQRGRREVASGGVRS